MAPIQASTSNLRRDHPPVCLCALRAAIYPIAEVEKIQGALPWPALQQHY